MNTLQAVVAAVLGLLSGYVALPLAFHLTRPLANRLVRTWRRPITLSLSVAMVATFFFLLVLNLGAVGAWLDMLARGDPDVRERVGKVWGLWMFFGLVAHGLVPTIEVAIRSRSSAGTDS